jgi:hypothetical protein
MSWVYASGVVAIMTNTKILGDFTVVYYPGNTMRWHLKSLKRKHLMTAFGVLISAKNPALSAFIYERPELF